MAERVLILDLATCTGFAMWEPGVDLRLGTNTLPKTGPDVGLFLSKFKEWLDSIISVFKPTIVVFECPWIGQKTSQDTARKLMCLAGFTEYCCQVAGIRYFEVQVRQWRKHFIGSGNLPRKQAHKMTMDACAALSIHPRNQDEADAFGMLDFVAHKLGIEPDWGRSDFAAGALFRKGA